LPFGVGLRICPAQNWVLTEVSYVLARIAQKWSDIECKDEVWEWVEKLRVTAASRNGVKVALIPT
jgi:cytochrome P450